MLEMIDKYAAYKALKHEAETHELSFSVEAYDRAARIIDQMPTIDAKPVRHGRWQPFYKDHGIKYYICSECSETSISNKHPYCHCGAKMDGGAEKWLKSN